MTILAGELIRVLPRVRAQAEVPAGDDLLPWVDQRVAALANNGNLPRSQRRRLMDHLPASQRSVAPDLSWLDRHDRFPALISVRRATEEDLIDYDLFDNGTLGSHNIPDPDQAVLVLCDVVVSEPARQHGLATALLQEFLAYADSGSFTVVAEFIPSGWLSAAARQALAHWYSRHGFRVTGHSEPESWELGDHMVRLPLLE